MTHERQSWKRHIPGYIGGSLLACLAGYLLSLATAAPDPAAVKTQGPDTQGNPVFTQQIGLSSAGSTQTPITASNTGANAAVTATLPGVAGKTTYIAGATWSSNGATTATNVTVTITGTISGTLNYVYDVAAVNAPGSGLQQVNFNPPIPASAVNTNIVVTLPALGAGNTNAAVSAWGYQQ